MNRTRQRVHAARVTRYDKENNRFERKRFPSIRKNRITRDRNYDERAATFYNRHGNAGTIPRGQFSRYFTFDIGRFVRRILLLILIVMSPRA